MPYEIHLIDSPGFDDGNFKDTVVLSQIAKYLNTIYLLKERLAGILYLHDITKARVGGIGERNLRMLEQLLGSEKFSNCTLVTTKWGCTTDPDGEEQREHTLSTRKYFFGAMLQNEQPHHNAAIRRFDPKSKGTALDIIKRYLVNRFTPHISEQMVSPKGPKLSLGETGAGKVVADGLEELANIQEKLERVAAARELLLQKYDRTLFENFKQKRKKLIRKIRLQCTGRWIMRTTIVGGAIAATVLTLGPGASAFVLEPAFEKVVRSQRKDEKREKKALEKEFRDKSRDAKFLKPVNPQWLWNTKVQSLEHLHSEGYSTRSVSSGNLLHVAKRGETVGFAVDEEEAGNDEMMIGKELDLDFESESEYDDSDMSSLDS